MTENTVKVSLREAISRIADEAFTVGRIYNRGGEKEKPAEMYDRLQVMIDKELQALASAEQPSETCAPIDNPAFEKSDSAWTDPLQAMLAEIRRACEAHPGEWLTFTAFVKDGKIQSPQLEQPSEGDGNDFTQRVSDYVADYELRDDSHFYSPTEGERFMIEDAIHGFFAMVEQDTLAAQPQPSEGDVGRDDRLQMWEHFEMQWSARPDAGHEDAKTAAWHYYKAGRLDALEFDTTTHPEAQAVAYVMSFEGEPRIAILRASALEPGTKLYLANDEAPKCLCGQPVEFCGHCETAEVRPNDEAVRLLARARHIMDKVMGDSDFPEDGSDECKWMQEVSEFLTTHKAQCQECDGRGQVCSGVFNAHFVKCPRCGGTGKAAQEGK